MRPGPGQILGDAREAVRQPAGAGAWPSSSSTPRTLGLEAAKFDKCLDSGEKAAIVDASKKAGEEAGVNGTPAFFINGRPLSGAQPFEKFKEIIDHELAASGS